MTHQQTTVDPDDALTPTQWAVMGILRAYPDGACRRVFAMHDIYEVSARIAEIEQRLGVTVDRAPCEAHRHRRRMVRYRI